MKIFFERSGGFAGQTLRLVLNLDLLSEPEAVYIGELLQDAIDTPLESGTGPTYTRDGFEYSLTLDEDGRKTSYKFINGIVPVRALPLLTELTTRAKSHRPLE